MANDGAAMVGVRVWQGEFSVNDVKIQNTNQTYRLINMPYYLVSVLDDLLKKYV
jgi:hypothetical protein